MDVTLGVMVDATEARIALLDAVPPHTVIDQSRIDLTNEPTDTLVSTLVSTDRTLAESGHRLVGTNVCSSDADTANGLRDALADADLTNVTDVTQSDAVTAVTRSLVDGETTASLVSAGDTAALSIVDSAADTTSLIAVEPIVNGDRGAAYRTLLERFSEEPGGATSVLVLGGPVDETLTADLNETSPVPLRFADAPEFALARGVALAGFRAQPIGPSGDHYSDGSLDWADTVMSAQAQQLAYSQVDDAEEFHSVGAGVPMQTPMQPLSEVDPEEFETEEDDASANRPRTLLLGSTVAALVVVGFAVIAVTVALNIRPEVDEQAVRVYEESLAGKYFPVAPGQGVNPDGPVWTMIEEVPPPGTDPGARTFHTQTLSKSSNTGDAGADVIKFFNDGTVGVIPNGGVLTPAGPGGVGPVGFPQATDFVTRLIPDFSRWSPCQVLALVSNMRMLTETALGATSSTAVTMNDILGTTDDITGVEDLGTVALVKGNQGPLFPTSGGAADTATDLAAIPEQIFEPDTSGQLASQVLPADTKLVDTEALEALPQTGGPGETSSAPIFGQVIPEEVGEVLPGTQGAAPVDPSLKVPDTAPDSIPGVPGTETGLPDLVPGNALPGDSTPPAGTPGTPSLPEGANPAVDDLPLSPPTPPLPDGREPSLGPAPLPKPSDIPELPKPQVPVIEAPVPPKVEAPQVEAPAPPPVRVPDPPVVEIPDPPVIQAPVIEAPAPAPAPAIEAPVIQAPAPVIQAPAPPVIQAPAPPVIQAPELPEIEAPAVPELPSLPVTTVPESPFSGGLFG